MSRNTWDVIKLNKNFNVNVFRRGLSFLIFGLLLNIGLGVLIFYIYINEPERDFYATSGIAPPVKLQPMLTRNMTSHPLLEPDPSMDDGVRPIPQ